MKNPYMVLGLSEGASAAEVAAAYRKLVLEHHPDRNPGDQDAVEMAKMINEAYETLSDPHKRGLFDQSHGNRSDNSRRLLEGDTVGATPLSTFEIHFLSLTLLCLILVADILLGIRQFSAVREFFQQNPEVDFAKHGTFAHLKGMVARSAIYLFTIISLITRSRKSTGFVVLYVFVKCFLFVSLSVQVLAVAPSLDSFFHSLFTFRRAWHPFTAVVFTAYLWRKHTKTQSLI